MEFLFGIVGFLLGAGLLSWLQQRQLANTQQRLQQVQKALEQTEALNQQQATELKQLRETQTQTEELEQYYQTQIQKLEQFYQAQLKELEQSPKPSPEPVLQEEALRQTEAYWEEIHDNEPENYLINPFLSKESEKKQESQETPTAELDLAQFLESEIHQDLGIVSLPELPELGQEQHHQPELDFFKTLSFDTVTVADLPEIPNNHSEDEDTLPDLFSDRKSESK